MEICAADPARLPHFERDPAPMTATRTTARGFLLSLLALALAAGVSTSSASAEVPPLVFPVVGEARYENDFGDARGQGSHEGNDIMAPWRALAVAAEAGTVKFWTTSWRAGCMLYLNGKSGTSYRYVHLNNDLTAENDNQGKCVPGIAYAPGLKDGAKVAAGQPIAYVGDSGDADGIHPHLHFEVHPDDGAAVSPYPYLRKARRLLFAAAPGSTFTLALSGKVVSAGGQDLALALDQVRSWPGGRKIKHDGQQVAVAVPETASLEVVGDPTGLAPFPALELLTKGLLVTVWTEPAKVTLAAQSGANRLLAAARVVVKSSG